MRGRGPGDGVGGENVSSTQRILFSAKLLPGTVVLERKM